MSNPTLAQIIAAITPLFAEAPVTQAPAQPPAAAPPPTVFAAGVNVGLPWVPGSNKRVAATYGDGEVLVVRFTTPNAPGAASLQISQAAGQKQLFRLATLATQPGVVAKAPGGTSQLSQSPVFHFVVGGTARLGVFVLAPSTTYYLNVINADSYGGAPTPGKYGALIDFNIPEGTA